MPTPFLDEFWNLVAESGLVEVGQIGPLREQAAATGAGTAAAAAAWLVDRGLLSRWQAKRLSAGNTGPFFLGDYRLLERHEREGDALAFTARHEPSGRLVSVVLLNAKQCRRIEVWTEIVRRTTAASRTIDPMLSRTWSLEQHEGSRLIVCEHVTGTSLAAELEALGPLPAAQAGVLVSQVARAVAEIQSHGGPHGGLSLDVLQREPPPGSVPRTGRVRLLQFPQAGDPHRLPLRPWTDDGRLEPLGRTAGFVAPELLLPGSGCDPRTDVYSIGAILYALVSGGPPCWEGSAAATLRRAAFEGPAPLEPPLVSDALARLVHRLMDRDPAARIATAAEAADALAACLGLAGGVAPAVSSDAVLPDFAALPAPAAPPARPSPGSPASKGNDRRSAGGPPATMRRRAARLRLVGAAITLAILAGTAALVVTRMSGSGAKPPSKKLAVATPRAEQSQPGGPPAVDGPKGWGVEPSLEHDGGTGKPATRDQAGHASSASGASGPVLRPVRQIVVDDPDLPWASPTDGPRPQLAYLPPGSQIVLLGRPAALTTDVEGARFLRALGPEVEAGLGRLAAWCGCEAHDIEFVQAGWQSGPEGGVVGGCAVRLVEGRKVPSDEAARRKAWSFTTAAEVDGETIHKAGTVSFWAPSAAAGRVLVVVDEPAVGAGARSDEGALIEQIVRRSGAARGGPADAAQPDLTREIEELVATLDEDRHVTLFGAPHALATQGRVMLAGPLAKLAEPVEEFFGDAVKAASLSIHLADNCYLELAAIATVDVPAKKLAPDLAARVEGMAAAVERYCASLDPSPYGRVLVMRLPQMIRLAVANARRGAEGQRAIVNAYLPRPAGHNLALAVELALAQAPGAAAAPPAAGPPPADALGKLERRITLAFARDTLEKSLQMIAEEVGVPIEILGPDLQLEGITKNQSFGLDARDKPAREILLEILAKANPEGKLVYVVGVAGENETILVTTRAAAEKRGDRLPPGLDEVRTTERKSP